jgi:outer membrane protein TolC
MFRTPVLAVIAASVMFWQAPAQAADPGAYTLDAVILEVLRRHPDLEISRLDAALAETEVMRVDAGLDPVLTARVGVSDDRTPVLSEFLPAEILTGTISGTLTQPLESGGTLSTTAEYARTRQRFTSPFATQLALINPAYRGGLSVNYRHPLLRGEGRPDFHDALLAAGAERDATRMQREVIARELGLLALNAGFRLLADDIGIRLAEIGVERAEQLLEYQQFREEFGLVEAADRIQIEALLALRRLELQRARAQQRANRVELNRLMLRAPDAPLELRPFSGAPPPGPPSIEDGVQLARAMRPEFQLIERQIEAEEARLRLARDAGRPQLDLVAEFGVFALERKPLDATMVDFHDRFAGISLELSDVLGRRAARAGILRSELAYRRLQSRIAQSVEQVRDELARIQATLATGEETLRLLRLRVAAEERKFEAETERYRDGRSDTATVIQFEGDMHVAGLEAELQALTLWLADRQFAWSRGTLFEEMGIDVDVLFGDEQ